MTDDEPKTPDDIVDHARLTAQAQGKVMLAEMITVLDEEIAARCASASAMLASYPQEYWNMPYWGRRTHVLESLLAFIQRIDNDVDARHYLAARFRRGDSGDQTQGQRAPEIPMDGGGDRQAP